MEDFVDLVICGPDMSGTSTQIRGVMDFLRSRGSVVRDLRGTEISALFHAKRFRQYNRDFFSFGDFSIGTDTESYSAFCSDAVGLLEGGETNEDLRVASMVDNNVSTYIDSNSADFWIMEEPTKRGAGQVNRVIEQNRSRFGSIIDPVAAAETHSVYRTDEFLRFRKVLREQGVGVIRSRSEESACYQIYDERFLKNTPWFKKVKKFARENGYVLTAFGRKRRIENLNLRIDPYADASEQKEVKKLLGEAYRKATNTPIQGTSADVTKIGMSNVFKYIERNNLDIHPVLVVHDDIVFEVNEKYDPEDIIPKLKSCLEMKFKGLVNLTVDNNISKVSWGAMKDG